MIRAIDHMVILVEDLAAASRDYTALGFTVTPGGEHADGATHNALIVFADDSYLELIAFKRAAPEHRWWHHAAHGEGLIDFALLPTAIEEDVAAARGRGLAFGQPRAGGRLRPDGRRVEWRSAQPETPDLPFLCGDVTPRALRVPEGAARHHANGALGIAEVSVAVSDLLASSGRYQALLGAEPAGLAVTISGFGEARFALGAAEIRLDGADSSSPAGARLASRGEGPLALRLRTDTASSTGLLDTARAHGVPIRL
jgi:hypothetical protein